MFDRKGIKEVVDNPEPNRFYVLVMRFYPHELRKRRMKLIDWEKNFGVWDRELAPSPQLLLKFRDKKINWLEYERIFKKEVPKQLVLDKMREYQKVAKGKIITFVCQEPDYDPHCHTHILLSYLAEEKLQEFHSLGY